MRSPAVGDKWPPSSAILDLFLYRPLCDNGGLREHLTTPHRAKRRTRSKAVQISYSAWDSPRSRSLGRVREIGSDARRVLAPRVRRPQPLADIGSITVIFSSVAGGADREADPPRESRPRPLLVCARFRVVMFLVVLSDYRSKFYKSCKECHESNILRLLQQRRGRLDCAP
ncbi:hypothetical protein EVAR_21364_1 [Eumeta japonica]|uniref:Uncharacterized protein n=1 Tax=Eumeta variegata TaxID=151549 RepID=A0A4C1YBP0_EUMVA|nr:hypothetical protein EVAR_21364_1 [Eumeta japonica]